MLNNELMEKQIDELRCLKVLASELEEEIKAIEDVIKADMVERNAEEVLINNYKVRYKEVTSSRLDSKALRAELPTIADKYTKMSKYMRLSIA